MRFIDANALIEAIRENVLMLKWLATQVNEEFVLHGLVLLEMLVGARDNRELKKIEQFAKTMRLYWPTNADYQKAQDLAKRHYQYGLGAVDAVIAASALNKRLPLCTLDQDFQHIPNLKIIEPYTVSQRLSKSTPHSPFIIARAHSGTRAARCVLISTHTSEPCDSTSSVSPR